MQEIPESFLNACSEQQTDLGGSDLETLRRYVQRLLEVNQQMNLTAVRDWEQAWMRHIFDSLLLLPWIKADPGQRAMDLGSGGGLPGIPLAILRPDMDWMLVESVKKKARFLEEVCGELELNNVKTSPERAEALHQLPEYRQQFHFVTARAVARLPRLLEWTIPFLRSKGIFAAMKGAQAEQELKESRRILERHNLQVLGVQPQPGGGNLCLFKKQK